MTKLTWDAVGSRLYETGVEKGVLYPVHTDGTYPLGVAWNGLTKVTETPSGAESTPFFADNIKYLNLIAAEDFGCTIEAYTFPDEFYECDGTKEAVDGLMVGQQPRKQFGLCYKTLLGNDVNGQSHGYKLHLIYGCLASPSERGYQSVNDSPEAINFSWEIATTPAPMTGYRPTAILVIDSTKVAADDLAALELILYGQTTPTSVPPRLPAPDEVLTILTPA